MTSSRSFKNGRWFVDGTNQLRDRFTVLSFSRLITWSWSTISSHIGQSNGWTEVRRHPFQVACWVKGPGFHSNFAKPGFHCTKTRVFTGHFRALDQGRVTCHCFEEILGRCGFRLFAMLGNSCTLANPGVSDWWLVSLVIGVCVYLQRVVIICDYHYQWLLIINIMVTFAQKPWQIIGLPKGPIVVCVLLCCFALCRDGCF